MLHRASSVWIFWHHFPFRRGSSGFAFSFMCMSWIPNLTSSCLAAVPGGKVTYAVTSLRVWCHTYLSVWPPLPAFGFCFRFSSSFFSSSSSSSLASSSFLPCSFCFCFASFASFYFLANSCNSIFLASSSSISSMVGPAAALAFLAASYFAFSSSYFFLMSCCFLWSSLYKAMCFSM